MHDERICCSQRIAAAAAAAVSDDDDDDDDARVHTEIVRRGVLLLASLPISPVNNDHTQSDFTVADTGRLLSFHPRHVERYDLSLPTASAGRVISIGGDLPSVRPSVCLFRASQRR